MVFLKLNDQPPVELSHFNWMQLTLQMSTGEGFDGRDLQMTLMLRLESSPEGDVVALKTRPDIGPKRDQPPDPNLASEDQGWDGPLYSK